MAEEGTQVAFTVPASDPDVPGQLIAFSLGVGAPEGTSIDSSSGQFTWTPSEAQGPANYSITVTVTDDGIPPLTTTTNFNIVVSESNSAPQFSSLLPDLTADEGSTVTTQAGVSDPDLPANLLTFALDPGGPAGAAVDPLTGVFSWTPSESQGPGVYAIMLRVTDDGTPALSATTTFNVLVGEANLAPALEPITDKLVDEGVPLSFLVTATDPDLPPNALTYSLETGAAAGAAIDPVSGLFTWTPSESQGPGTYSFTVRVADGGPNSLVATRSFAITVREANRAPTNGVLSELSVAEGSLLSFQVIASDPDLPANTLNFALEPGAPAGAAVDPLTGVFSWTPSESQGPGVYAITVRVTDNGTPALSATLGFTVTVQEINQAPVLSIPASLVVPENKISIVQAAAQDPDSPPNGLIFKLGAEAPAWASINPTNGALRLVPLEEAGPGVSLIQVIVQDDGQPSISATNSVTVTVIDINEPPFLIGAFDRFADEQTPVSFATAIDDDVPANVLSYQIDEQLPEGAVLDPSTGIFSWTPSEAQGPAAYTFTLTVTDNGIPPYAETETFTLFVQEVNRAPQLGSIEDLSVQAGGTVVLGAVATDPDLPQNQITYSLEAGAPPAAVIDPVTGAFSWPTTIADGPQTYQIVVRATDNGSPPLSATEAFTVFVSDTNLPPKLEVIADQTVEEGSQLSILAIATDPSPPSNALTFALDQGAPEGATINPATGLLTWTPSEAQGPGNHTITVRVTDNGLPALSATRTFNVFVGEANLPPSLDAITDKLVDEAVLLSFLVTASDPDLPLNALTYSLETGAAAGAAIDPVSGLFTWTPSESQGPGTYSFTVRVADNGPIPLVATNSFTVTVGEANLAPTIEVLTDRSVAEGSPLLFQVVASDADLPANELSFALDPGAPAGATVDPATGIFSWTPSESQGPGVHAITVRVTDSGSPLQSASSTFNVTVRESNLPPIVEAVGNQLINEGSLFSLTIVASDSDLPANRLTFSLDSGAPSGTAIDPVTGVFTWTPTELQGPSTNTISVRVADDGTPALAASNTFTVVVQEVNRPPTMVPIANHSTDEGSLVSFQAVASDSDFPANRLTYSMAPGSPTGATIEPITGVFTWTPSESQGPRLHEITVRVTDDSSPSLSATQTFEVEVKEVNEPPQLTAAGVQTIDENQAFDPGAVDPDLPANRLTYQFVGVAQSARLQWRASTEASVAGYRLYLMNPVGNSWELHAEIPGRTTTQYQVTGLVAGQSYDFHLTAYDTEGNESFPTEAVRFAGPLFHPETGNLEWIPADLFGGTRQEFLLSVSDGETPHLDAEKFFTLDLRDVNQPPELSYLPDRVFEEGWILEFPVEAHDADIPQDTLIYSLEPGSPSWATIDPQFGWIRMNLGEELGGTTHRVGVRVTDNGTPSMHATASFTVQVLEANQPPTLAGIADRTVNEGEGVSLQASASDADQPADRLTYSLGDGAPPGASVDPVTGLFSWIPGEAQGPGTYVVTLQVTDDGDPPLSYSQAFTVNVGEINRAPVLTLPSNPSVDEGTALSFQATAVDPDLPANSLTFSLGPGAPSGASLDPVSGVFSWTPTESDGPGDYSITVRVTDNGSPILSTAQSLTVKVREANRAPSLAPLSNLAVDEGSTAALQATAGDPDLPANSLTFALTPDAPSGAAIHPVTGFFSWTPAEYQGPSTNVITIQVSDNGSPSLSDSRSFLVIVREVNRPPILISPPDTETYPLVPVELVSVATDPDLPANRLTFTLERGPDGAELDPITGILRWKPDADDADQTFPIKISVDDNGYPSLSTKVNFNIRVLPLPEIDLRLTQEADGSILLQFSGIAGVTYGIFHSADLLTWTEVLRTNSLVPTFSISLTPYAGDRDFYRVEAQ